MSIHFLRSIIVAVFVAVILGIYPYGTTGNIASASEFFGDFTNVSRPGRFPDHIQRIKVDEKFLNVAAVCKFLKSKYDKDVMKVVTSSLEEGLNNKLFKEASAEKPLRARITTNVDGEVTEIRVFWAGEQDKRKLAEELCDMAMVAEKGRQFGEALEFYRQAQNIFPDEAKLRERIQVCLPQGTADDLRAFIGTGAKGAELAYTQRRLDELLLPKLTTQQQKRWEEAEDKLIAQAQLAEDALGGEAPPDLTLAREAIKILEGLADEQRGYLPIYVKLGLASEYTREFQSGSSYYNVYLAKYEVLGYPPADLRTVRIRRDLCDSRAKGLIVQGREEEQRRKLKIKEDAIEELRKSIKKNSAFVLYWGSITERGVLSFDGPVLVLTRLNEPDPRMVPTLSAGFLKGQIFRVDPKFIDPAKIKYQKVRDGNVGPGSARYYFEIETVDGEKKIKAEYIYNAKPTEQDDELSKTNLFVADERKAEELAKALRELIKLSSP